MVIGITMNAECFDYQSNNSMMQTGPPGYRHTSMQANSWTQRKYEAKEWKHTGLQIHKQVETQYKPTATQPQKQASIQPHRIKSFKPKTHGHPSIQAYVHTAAWAHRHRYTMQTHKHTRVYKIHKHKPTKPGLTIAAALKPTVTCKKTRQS